jgi:hypothetical protein
MTDDELVKPGRRDGRCHADQESSRPRYSIAERALWSGLSRGRIDEVAGRAVRLDRQDWTGP